MPLVQTRGAASAQGFGEFARATAPVFIEDTFSCFLYTGTRATQTITNGIDLSGKGGLLWIKNRVTPGSYHALMDTVRGNNKEINANRTDAQSTSTNSVTSFLSNGFTLGSDSDIGNVNYDFQPYVSWTFREQAKFFDVVTWTGSGANRTISHALGSVPACIIVKRTDTTADWAVYHRSLANTQYLVLNTTAAAATGATWWNSTTPTSTEFSLGTDASVNSSASGATYIAYIFAHDAGGFGLTGTDNVISCGSFTTDGSGNFTTQNIGYEPQWLMIKSATSLDPWIILDNMRGLNLTQYVQLFANTSGAENSGTAAYIFPTATGFGGSGSNLDASATYIYIAIRRGPMKVPTLGTSVFTPNTYTGTGATLSVSGLSFPPDMVIPKWRSNGGSGYSTRPGALYDKLRGAQQELAPTSTAAESTQSTGLTSFNQSGFTIGTSSVINSSPDPYISWNFKRSPSFFDEVCYSGTGSAQNVTHNLTVAPELMIFKSRSNGGGGYSWVVGSSALPSWGRYLQLNEVDAVNGSNNAGPFNNTTPTSSVFTVNTWSETNGSGATYVAYLFATCAGVSKVFSYTGNGSSQTINCGFTAGSRWVMIKRTDSTGDWYVWDSARGIVAGNDPHLSLNTTAAEVTSDDSVDTDNTGFVVNQLSATNVNVTSATYIGIAIA